MKAIILAAGKGTRVRPLTYDLPKPMIPVLGKPVMAYLVEHLAKYGVTEIMVNVSYLHEKIEEFFGEGNQYGVQIGYSFEGYTNDSGDVVPEPLGSAGGMKKIQEFGGFFDDTTIVLCGDALIDLDLKSALFEHRRKGALASSPGARLVGVADSTTSLVIGSPNLSQLDLLQIDVEGMDGELLKLYPFDLIRPGIIRYESKHLATQESLEVENLLRKQGYELFREGPDTVASQ